MFIVNCKSHSIALNGDEMIDRYFSDIRKFKVLTDKEQKTLLAVVKNGTLNESLRARTTLIECNQRIVASVARHLTNGDDFNDLVSEGTLGLNQAIDKFDLQYKQHFLTYAIFWINKYMRDYLVNESGLITTKNANKAYAYVETANNEFFLKNCRYPTVEELQDILSKKGVDFAHKEDLVEVKVFSWEEFNTDIVNETPDEEHPSTFDAKCCERENSITKKYDEEYINQLSKILIQSLDETEQYIIKHYYGIGCFNETLETIAEKLNMKKKRLEEKYNAALDKMKKLYIKIDEAKIF